MISRRRWLAGWGLLSLTYLTLAVLRAASDGELGGMVVYVVAAVITFAFAVAVIPFVVPPRPDDGGDDDSDDGGGPGPGAGGPEPPWWPEFERDFRRHADEPAGVPRRSRPGERSPA